MSASSSFRDMFAQDITVFVDTLLNNSQISAFTWSLFIVLVVIVYFTEWAKFMLDGFDLESAVNATIMVFVSLLLFTSYQVAFDNAVALFDELGLIIQEVATGHRDPFFLFKWVTHAFNSMYNEDVSIFMMPVGDVIYAALWYLVAIILQLVMFAISSWAVWTLALAKILGVLFIPLLIHPATRNLFDGWFRFTLGSLFLLIVLRATGSLVALAIKAQFSSIGAIVCGDSTDFSSCGSTDRVVNMAMNGADNIDVLVTGILSIILVVSSLTITTALVGAVASPSRGASSGASKLTKMAMGKFMPPST
ncbi:type IV secretion system protein [Aliivibrio sp. SR45-2]|uniref:type IV secretion system protein n=1 Tax=Aliivibrio sp. SR45-2 TaxID=2760931 RepID=UPI0015FDB1FC|nr:type IV secretion system protein [Aliivibrio sp. SR45-2]MBB1313447.1 type IV secretion system protein [Aliivibrio sp. SR45-2]